MVLSSKGMMVLACLLMVSVLLAQPDPGKARQRLAQFKKLKLIEVLDLDEQTAEKFFIRYNEGQKKIDQARLELQQSVRELQDAVRAKVSDAELNAKSDHVVKQMQQLAQAMTERLAAVRPLLSPQQYAKLVVFEVRFTEALQRTLMQRAKPGMRERDRRRIPPLEEPD